MKRKKSVETIERSLRKCEKEAVAAIDNAIARVSKLALARDEAQMSSSRVKSVMKELAELRKIVALYMNANTL